MKTLSGLVGLNLHTESGAVYLDKGLFSYLDTTKQEYTAVGENNLQTTSLERAVG